MIKILAFLWSGCWHKWKILRRTSIFENTGDSMPSYFSYELQCEKCGTVRGKHV